VYRPAARAMPTLRDRATPWFEWQTYLMRGLDVTIGSTSCLVWSMLPSSTMMSSQFL